MTMPPTMATSKPVPMYMAVTCHPTMPGSMITATSLIMGEAMRNEKVTPSGMPDSTNPMNSGTAEQEQNGVIMPGSADSGQGPIIKKSEVSECKVATEKRLMRNGGGRDFFKKEARRYGGRGRILLLLYAGSSYTIFQERHNHEKRLRRFLSSLHSCRYDEGRSMIIFQIVFK
jgi:hypothetical protein